MREIVAYPPNYDVIKQLLAPTDDALYCYGDTIYNPTKRKILPDVMHHEAVHARQQGSNPDQWWYDYLTDKDFRLSQEIEAYGEQYLFAQKHIEAQAAEAAKEGKVLTVGRKKLLSWALESMAKALSGAAYGNLISYGEAESKIRNYAKHHDSEN